MSLILFDFDFTLGDSSTGILECFRYALESCGLPIPEGPVMLSTIGMRLEDAFSLFAPDFPPDKLIRKFRELADEIMTDSVQVYGDVEDMASTLQSRGYKTGIVSTKLRKHIVGALEREGIADLFDVVIGGRDVTRLKPDPEGIDRAIRALGVEKESVTYVGDTVIDLQTAQSAEVGFIGVSTGPTPDEEFLRHGVPVVSRLDELLAFFPACDEERCHV